MKFGPGILVARLAVIAAAYSSEEGDVSMDARFLEYCLNPVEADCA